MYNFTLEQGFSYPKILVCCDLIIIQLKSNIHYGFFLIQGYLDVDFVIFHTMFSSYLFDINF